jgi:glutathione peroxidase-family protein
MVAIIIMTIPHLTSASKRLIVLLVQVLVLFVVAVGAFTTLSPLVSVWSVSSSLSTTLAPTSTSDSSLLCLKQQLVRGGENEEADSNGRRELLNNNNNRRSFLSTASSLVVPAAVASGVYDPTWAFAAEETTTAEDESFASIAARASSLSKEAGDRAVTSNMNAADGDTRTAYDFDLPIGGEPVRFEKIIRQSIDDQTGQRSSTVRVILVVNMKEDDPIARKDIPELMSLAARYGRGGEFAVVMSPSDQGYYEPDTSQLIRLKLSSEYGFGINPATVVTDKVNLLGKMAHPFWRWLQKNCRTPAGLGRIEGNFEKFLIDGRTGIPLRRYPRRYKPLDISNDIEAILAGRPLPPAGANYLEQWRSASVEAERDTYRFQKGLNYYD